MFFSFLAALLFQLLYALGKPQQIRDTKIRSFTQFPCKGITYIFIARKVLQLFFFFYSEMENLPPHAHSVVRFGWQMSFRAHCKVHYWERDDMWQSSVSSYIFVLGDCGRNTCKLMFMLCFRHKILVVFVRLCDCLSPQTERRMGNKVTPVALMLQLCS